MVELSGLASGRGDRVALWGITIPSRHGWEGLWHGQPAPRAQGSPLAEIRHPRAMRGPPHPVTTSIHM